MRFSMQLVAREAPSQLVKEPESMERQSLFQALLKGTSGLAVELLQFGVETGEPLLGGLVGRLLVGPLEPGSPRFLVLLRQVTQNVFALVPLAALDLGSLAEDLVDSLAQSFAPVDNAKNALLEGESSPQKVPQQLSDRLRTL
jgi:hypothetical protein